ncbi:hypothetical protein F383_05011 [Gossypium arboreum]|uniref:Uncharacterized protein n=1 Tax=Gossypium arboreum TaxID=29729 RepID=A0A0B0PCP5_GOSAR|nr:hypothetical protein F383_05011 [Gossypium arboreum]
MRWMFWWFRVIWGFHHRRLRWFRVIRWLHHRWLRVIGWLYNGRMMMFRRIAWRRTFRRRRWVAVTFRAA